MAKRGPTSSRKPGQPQEPDDAFIARVLELTAWARRNSQRLIVGAAVLVLLVAGIVYYANLQRTHAREAEQELERVQQLVATAPSDQAKEELRTFLDQYGDTPFAHEARLTLGELHLHEGEAEEAANVLQPTREAMSDPVAVQGVFLLGVALEEQGRWQEAEDVYLELAEATDLRFQRVEALQSAARVRTEREDFQGAIDLYRQVVQELEEDDPRRARLELRIGELEARAQS